MSPQPPNQSRDGLSRQQVADLFAESLVASWTVEFDIISLEAAEKASLHLTPEDVIRAFDVWRADRTQFAPEHTLCSHLPALTEPGTRKPDEHKMFEDRCKLAALIRTLTSVLEAGVADPQLYLDAVAEEISLSSFHRSRAGLEHQVRNALEDLKFFVVAATRLGEHPRLTELLRLGMGLALRDLNFAMECGAEPGVSRAEILETFCRDVSRECGEAKKYLVPLADPNRVDELITAFTSAETDAARREEVRACADRLIGSPTTAIADRVLEARSYLATEVSAKLWLDPHAVLADYFADVQSVNIFGKAPNVDMPTTTWIDTQVKLLKELVQRGFLTWHIDALQSLGAVMQWGQAGAHGQELKADGLVSAVQEYCGAQGSTLALRSHMLLPRKAETVLVSNTLDLLQAVCDCAREENVTIRWSSPPQISPGEKILLWSPGEPIGESSLYCLFAEPDDTTGDFPAFLKKVITDAALCRGGWGGYESIALPNAPVVRSLRTIYKGFEPLPSRSSYLVMKTPERDRGMHNLLNAVLS